MRGQRESRPKLQLAEDRSSVRQTRRTAYLDFLEQAHVTGELYYRLGDVYVQVADPNDQLARIDDLRSDLRDAFDPLMRAARMVVLEGPAAVAEAAEAVRQAASDANRAMWRITQSDAGARDHFDAARHVFQTHLTEFIEASRTAAAELR
jgi:Fe-S cluster assembly scaffold protein SufB